MVINIDTAQVLIHDVYMANNLWSRLWGLIPKKRILPDEGILLTPSQGVHTFLMRFAIDVIYLDKSFKVLDVFENVKPWRILPLNFEAKHVLEIPPGKVQKTGTRINHYLFIGSNRRGH